MLLSDMQWNFESEFEESVPQRLSEQDNIFRSVQEDGGLAVQMVERYTEM